MKALSIRQPWAFLICAGYKEIENRNWPTNLRGRILIHASKGMTIGEYEDAIGFAHSINPAIQIPNYHQLARGGIVGAADLVDCVIRSKSPWFVGEYGFVLQNQSTIPFRQLKGALGFFDVPTLFL